MYDNDNNIAHYHPLVAILRRLPVSLQPLLHILHSLRVSRYTAISYFQVAAIHVSISLQGNYISQYLVSAIFYHYAFHHHPRCLYYLSSSQSHVFASNFISSSASSIKVISTIRLHAFLHLPSLAFGHIPSSPINNLILLSNTGSLKLNNYPQPYPLSSIRRSQWKLGQTLLPLCVTLTRTLIITSEPVADTSVCFTVLGVVLESVYLSSATTCIKY